MTRNEFRSARAHAGIRRRWPDAVFLGVCATLAARFGIGAWWIRAVILVALISAPLVTIVVYLLAAVFLARRQAWRWPA